MDLSSLLGVCGAMQNCHSEPKIHLAREDKGERGKDGDMRKGKKNEHENENRDCGGMQRWSGGCSFAQCTVLCFPFPSSRHHPEHEHFFNHSRKSGVEPSGGRVSHCSVCSHHAHPPRDIAMPHSSMSPALHPSPSLPFPSLLSLTLLTLPLSCLVFLSSPLFSFPTSSRRPASNITCPCHCVICFVPFIAPPPPTPLFSSCSGWIETFCLLQGMLILPY